ncbi:dephospho-CoA kinase [Romboutsia lituseburensis]|uniref:dephospho-CoA kinase n=1 Tax=Romboutsia lituseburensis TaxID=1537 RepID=UPI00215B249C|nr:dephospho-CoA kinase [Romboutsia lituseburensis]MCR8746485.1 dephospho-CoA kinase [Romboutsia lituseburensis]
MLILGLTGNIGCGKSSLSNIFMNNNIKIIDADIISRQIFEDRDILQMVFNHFGDGIKNRDNTLNRKALGSIVFNNDKKLIELNELTHPQIYMKIVNQIKKYKLMEEKIVVIDAALLIEGGYLEIIDKLIVVICNKEEQIKRIQYRDACTREDAISRINSQIKQEEKIKFADYVIDNSGDINKLKLEAEKCIAYIKENWCE